MSKNKELLRTIKFVLFSISAGIIVTGLCMACNLITEYIYDRFFVFRATLDTNEIAKKKTSEN